MGRPKRAADGGLIYHVLNRANARMTIFEKPEDFVAFEQVLEEAVERTKMRLLAYCVMSSHWHLVLWPHEDGELSRFTGWLTLTHTQRWHAHRHSTGSGHLYQGRFKSFPVQDDEHFLTVCRYVERNALRANLVRRAEQWRWGSLYRWHRGSAKENSLLSAWPLRRLANWVEEVNAPQTEAELSALRRAVDRGCPFGEEYWSEQIVRRLGLESTVRPQGRPKKETNGS
jgi:putative transposase